MPAFETEQDLLRAVRNRLDGWLSDARVEAYEALFEGEDAILSASELRTLDQVDSRLSREEGQGLWGADKYGIIPTGTLDEESAPRVVCTNHPQVPADAYPGGDSLEDDTRSRLNDALWEYCQQIVERTQTRLEEFVWSSAVATWEQ